MKYPVTYISQSLKMMRALLVSYVVTALFLLLTAALVYRAGLDESKVQIAVILIYICLLYTSPSPRDISGSRMPSSA